MLRAYRRLEQLINDIKNNYDIEDVLVRFSDTEKATFNPQAYYISTPLGTYAYPLDFIFKIENDTFLVRERMYGLDRKYIHFFVKRKNAKFLYLDENSNFTYNLEIAKQLIEIGKTYGVNLEEVLFRSNSVENYITFWLMCLASIFIEHNSKTFQKGLSQQIQNRQKNLPYTYSFYRTMKTIEQSFFINVEDFSTTLKKMLEKLYNDIKTYIESKNYGIRTRMDIAQKASFIIFYQNDYLFDSSIPAVSTSKQHILLTSLLRRMGYDGVWDRGYGAIHPNEPAQAVWWNPKAAYYISIIQNPLKPPPTINKDKILNLLEKEGIDKIIDVFLPHLYKKYTNTINATFGEEANILMGLSLREFAEKIKTKKEEMEYIFKNVIENKDPDSIIKEVSSEFKDSEFLKEVNPEALDLEDEVYQYLRSRFIYHFLRNIIILIRNA